jgi:hypothetical protein
MAGAVHPPGAYALEVALPGYGVDCRVVTPDTVLVMETSMIMETSNGLSDHIIDQELTLAVVSAESETVDYPLRL